MKNWPFLLYIAFSQRSVRYNTHPPPPPHSNCELKIVLLINLTRGGGRITGAILNPNKVLSQVFFATHAVVVACTKLICVISYNKFINYLTSRPETTRGHN